jgi:hypothetical protein
MGQAVVIEVIDALTRTGSRTTRNDKSRTEEPPQGARKKDFLRQHAGPSAGTSHCTELIRWTSWHKRTVRVIIVEHYRTVRQLCRFFHEGNTKRVMISSHPGNCPLVWLLLKCLVWVRCTKGGYDGKDCLHRLASCHWDSTGLPATRLLTVLWV